MTDPVFGLTFNTQDTDPLPPAFSDFSVLGITLPSDDADPDAFPLNQAVDINTGDPAVLAAAGTGDLAKYLALVNAQLADLQVSARAVVVRVAQGVDDTHTIANIIGDPAAQTGLYALLTAPQKLSVTPRLITTPGYTWQQPDDGHGGLLANPICAALPPILEALMGHAFVGSGPLSKTAAAAWRQTMNSLRLIPVSNRLIVGNGVSNLTLDAAGAVAGLGVRVDFQNQGYPFYSFANQAIQGILGLERYDSFSLLDGATDGQIFLSNNIGVVERGDASDTAIADAGFIFIGTDNAGDDALWPFYNQRRGRDFVHLAMLKSIRKRLGVNNITPHGVQAVENDMAAVLVDVQQHDGTIGWKIGFEASTNSPENLRKGRFRVFFNSEEPAPIKIVDIDSRRYRDALTAELGTLVQQASTLVG